MGGRGFTLIELLISITIIGVLLVLVMGAFRIGINAWEKGEADIETYQRQQIVLQLVKQQIASMRRAEIRKENEEPYYFKGNEYTVEFISDKSVVPGNQYGRVFVKYRIREADAGQQGKTLEIHEADLVTAAGAQSVFEPREEDFHVLLDGMAEIRFEYLVPEEEADTFEWQAVWDPEAVEADIPPAIRLTLQADAEKTPAVRAVGRIVPELRDN
ncbi:MAG: prepilin-type N-terminal cleavage/methylation domain-containing protein [Desulfobacterales bacterium]